MSKWKKYTCSNSKAEIHGMEGRLMQSVTRKERFETNCAVEMVTDILYEPLHHSRHSRPIALSYSMNFIGKQTCQVVIVYLLCKRAEMQLSPGHRPAEPNANTTLRQPGWLVALSLLVKSH